MVLFPWFSLSGDVTVVEGVGRKILSLVQQYSYSNQSCKYWLMQRWNFNLNLFLVDFDECDTGADSCDTNAYCNNTIGSHNCTCYSGYTGNGTTCTGEYSAI